MDPILLQKQVRDNSDELRTYLKDLSSWEDEMKRKESSLGTDATVKEIPTVRSKVEKLEKPTKKEKKQAERIRSYDYKAWDNFDVEAECEKLDNEKALEQPMESSDSEDNDVTEEYQTRLREEATYEKERGNQFVKQQKWNEAISCYTHAISCNPKDPIYFANRALCHLKKDDLHSAEADCTSALQFDPNYVKALQRRGAARIGLKQYNEAVTDLKKVLQIEPNNKESKKELEKVEKFLDSKQNKNAENILKYIPPQEKKVEATVKPIPKESQIATKHLKPSEKHTKLTEIKIDKTKTSEIKIPWPARPNSKPMKTIQKLPHLRSKTPLQKLTVVEIDGITEKLKDIDKPSSSGLKKNLSEQNNADKEILVADLAHLHTTPLSDIQTKCVGKIINRPVPKSSVQFVSSWKLMKNNNDEKFLYLKNIKAEDIPKIFQEAMESDIFGDILNILSEKFVENNLDVFLYLKYLATVKRFATLVMFMSSNDKKALKKMYEYCIAKNVAQEEMDILKKKYEI